MPDEYKLEIVESLKKDGSIIKLYQAKMEENRFGLSFKEVDY